LNIIRRVSFANVDVARDGNVIELPNLDIRNHSFPKKFKVGTAGDKSSLLIPAAARFQSTWPEHSFGPFLLIDVRRDLEKNRLFRCCATRLLLG